MSIKDLSNLVVGASSPSLSYLGEQLKPFSRMPGGIFNKIRNMNFGAEREASGPSTVDAMLNNLENQQYNNPMNPRTDDMMPMQQTPQFNSGSGGSEDSSSSDVLRQVNSSIARMSQIVGKGNEINRAGFERLFGSMNASVRGIIDIKNLLSNQQMLLQSIASSPMANNPTINSGLENTDTNTINMIDLLERIAIASEQHLLLDKLKSGLGEHGSIRKTSVRNSITKFDPYDSGSLNKEDVYTELLDATRNSNNTLNEVRDSLKFKAFQKTKNAAKEIAKSPFKLAGAIWKYSTKRVIEEGATNIKAKMMAKREERENKAIQDYAEAVKNGDEQAKKAAKYKLKKAGISDYITNKLDYGASASSVSLFKDRVTKRNDAAVFDKEVRDTVVNGIPLLLSEIIKAINGSDVKYNYGTDSLTDTDTKMSTEVAMAKEKVLDLQNKRSKIGFLRKDGAWQDYKDLDNARKNVDNIELIQKNQHGKIDLYGKTIESIHDEHGKKGVKSYKDMAEFFKNTSGSLDLGDAILEKMINAFHKVNNAHNGVNDWIGAKYKKFTTGQDTYNEFNSIDEIANNPIDLLRLLRNNDVDENAINAEITEKYGNVKNSNPDLLSSINNMGSNTTNLTVLEDNTTENNVLLKEIIEILNEWRWGRKGGSSNSSVNQINNNNSNNIVNKQQYKNPIGPNQNNPWSVFSHLTVNSKMYGSPIGPMPLPSNRGGGLLSNAYNKLSSLNPLNKISNAYNSIKSTVGEKLQSLNPVSYFKNKFAKIKEAKLQKAEEKSYKDIHSTNKSIHKIEKMMSRHYRWLRGKAFMDIIGGAISTGMAFLETVLGSLKNTLGTVGTVLGVIAGAIGLNKLKDLFSGGDGGSIKPPPGGENGGGGKPPGEGGGNNKGGGNRIKNFFSSLWNGGKNIVKGGLNLGKKLVKGVTGIGSLFIPTVMGNSDLDTFYTNDDGIEMVRRNTTGEEITREEYDKRMEAFKNQPNAKFKLTTNGPEPLAPSSMQSKTAADIVTKNANSSSKGKCAAYVREGLEDAGYKLPKGIRPGSAYMYGDGVLQHMGFQQLNVNPLNYNPAKGDVSVTMPFGNHKHGHIAMYNGQNWVSDFKQKNIVVHKDFPYANAENQIKIFRDQNNGSKVETKKAKNTKNINEANNSTSQEYDSTEIPGMATNVSTSAAFRIIPTKLEENKNNSPKRTFKNIEDKEQKATKEKPKEKVSKKITKQIEKNRQDKKQISPASNINKVISKKINADNKKNEEVDYKKMDLTNYDNYLKEVKRIDEMGITDIRVKHNLLSILESTKVEQHLAKIKDKNDSKSFTNMISLVQNSTYLSEELKNKYMEKIKEAFPDFSMTGLNLNDFKGMKNFRVNFERASLDIKSKETGKRYKVKAFAKQSLEMKFASMGGNVKVRLDLSDDETYKSALSEINDSNISDEQKKKEIAKLNLQRIIVFMKKYKIIDNDKDYNDLRNMIINSELPTPETRTELMAYLQDMDARDPMKKLPKVNLKKLDKRQILATADGKLKLSSDYNLLDDDTFNAKKEEIYNKFKLQTGQAKDYKKQADSSMEMKKLEAIRLMQKINSHKSIDDRKTFDVLMEELRGMDIEEVDKNSIYTSIANKVTFDDEIKYKYGTFKDKSGTIGKSIGNGGVEIGFGDFNAIIANKDWNDPETIKALKARNPHLDDKYIEERKALYNLVLKYNEIKKKMIPGKPNKEIVDELRKLNNEAQNNKFIPDIYKASISDTLSKAMSENSITKLGFKGAKYQKLANGFKYYDPVEGKYKSANEDLTNDKIYNSHLQEMESQVFSSDDEERIGEIQNARLQQLLKFRYNGVLNDEQFGEFKKNIDGSKYLSDKERMSINIDAMMKKSNFTFNDTNAIIDMLKESKEGLFTEEEKEEYIEQAKALAKAKEAEWQKEKKKPKIVKGNMSKEEIMELVKKSDTSFFKNNFSTSAEYVAELADLMSGSDSTFSRGENSGGLFNIDYETQEKAFNANRNDISKAFGVKELDFEDSRVQVYTGLIFIESLKRELKEKYKLEDEDISLKMVKAAIEKDTKTLTSEIERAKVLHQIMDGYDLKRNQVSSEMLNIALRDNGNTKAIASMVESIKNGNDNKSVILADNNSPSSVASSAVLPSSSQSTVSTTNNTTNNNNNSLQTERTTVNNNVYIVDKGGNINKISSNSKTTSSSNKSAKPINPDIFAAANS